LVYLLVSATYQDDRYQHGPHGNGNPVGEAQR
jgi:hypothetical protein